MPKKTTKKKNRKKRQRYEDAGTRFFAQGILAVFFIGLVVAALLYFGVWRENAPFQNFTDMQLSETTREEKEFVSEDSNQPTADISVKQEEADATAGAADVNASIAFQDDALSVIVLDVGQGNAVIIRTPNGSTMLVDAGERDQSQRLLGYLEELGVEKIDALIGTHPHSDHIGGMQTVIQNYPVTSIYMPRAENESKTYINLLTEIRERNMKVKITKGGTEQTIVLDPEVEVRILAPLDDQYEKLNNYSIVLRLQYGEKSILLPADAEKLSEKEMIEKEKSLLASDVLLLGHHGSSTSSSKVFLQAVHPSAAIISCGIDNDYGHPHREVLERIDNMQIPLYRTDLNGSISVFIKKDNITFQTEREAS